MQARVAIAGWNIPKENAEHFGAEGSHLERYAQRFSGVEINSSFYKDHREATYKRWAATVPKVFRFSVKLSRRLTHEGKLLASKEEIETAVRPILALGEKLGVLLVQLPPRLFFQEEVADRFFARLREICPAPITCEPRHLTWLAPAAQKVFRVHRISKVLADPAPCPDQENIFSHFGSVSYYRLHGSPKMYFSAYSDFFLRSLATIVAQERRPTWVVFDNTAEQHAIADAIQLQDLLRSDAKVA